ncbi:MAG: YceI family protein [Sulfuricella sp.]|nr:YceI family protein [Sulfuricella sp.]
MIRLLATLALLASGTIHAAEFSAVQRDKSSISFVSKQMNVPVEGAFRKFTAQIALDPARPETGRARIEVDPAGIDTGNDEANDEVKGKNWFNVREFPKAAFAATGVKPLGGGRYEATGKLTLKGKTVDLRVPFTLRQEKGGLAMDGSFPIKRLDYGIGSGVWGDTSVVADEVLVKFHFVLTK